MSALVLACLVFVVAGLAIYAFGLSLTTYVIVLAFAVGAGVGVALVDRRRGL